jgi:hypothetical protein
MGDWFRSITVLGLAFVGAVAVTIGLANVIVPGRAAGPQAADGTDDGGGAPAPSLQPIQGVGGHLTVSGDREGTLTLTQEDPENGYMLVGGNGRMVFTGRPPVVTQVSWDGLEFFPEPTDCTIVPGELDDEIGVGYAELRCEGLTDIRSGEVIDMAGTVGMALTTIGESDLPEMGGSIAVGGETWAFPEAILFTFPINLGVGGEDYNMILTREGTDTGCPGPDCSRTSLRFRYDVQTHRLTVVSVEREGQMSDLGPGACTLATDELGRLTPGTAVVELSVECPAAEVPGLGTVPITGTLIVQQVDFVP